MRMLGYNSPELKDKNPEIKAKAIEAKELFKEMVLNKVVDIECGKFDAFGRILGTIKLDDKDINKIMLDKYGPYIKK